MMLVGFQFTLPGGRESAAGPGFVSN